MNRKNLTAAVLAGLAGAAGIVGSAQAVNINPDGLGQVLVYPYYTVNNGNMTFFSVVNTTDWAKAVKVRFLEGMNSREVLDFNLYMSHHDVWVASIKWETSENSLGVSSTAPTLTVRDNTCTVPYIRNFTDGSGVIHGKQPFMNFAYSGANTDGGPTTIDRAAEGHFEMLEMGTMVGSSALAATHTTARVPPITFNPANSATGPCEQLIGAWSTSGGGIPGYWLVNPLRDLVTHTGGLFGSAGVINVPKASLYSYDPHALNDWTRSLWTDGDDPILGQLFPIHRIPGSTEPSLNSGDQLVGTIFLSTPVAPAIALSNLGAFTRGVDAVSYTFMRDQLMNEYTTQASVLGATEWVITFPTKNFYVDPVIVGAVAIPPFTKIFTGTACEIVELEIWDREEQQEQGTPSGPIVSPPPPGDEELTAELCYETNVVQFNSSDDLSVTPSGILGSSNGISIDNGALGFNSGWMRIGMHRFTDALGVVNFRGPLGGLVGLPVTGFSVSEFTNGSLGAGVVATYGGLWEHKYTRQCSLENTAGIVFGCPFTRPAGP